MVIYIGITENDPQARWKQHIDKTTRNRDICRIDQYLLEGNNARLCSFHVTGTYDLADRSELEHLEKCLITRHIMDNPQVHMLLNVDKVEPRLGKKRKPVEISQDDEDDDDSECESTCSAGSRSLTISDLTDETREEEEPVAKRVRTSMFGGKYGVPLYDDARLVPDHIFSYTIKVVHHTDKRGEPVVTHKLLVKRGDDLLPTGKPREMTKTFYPIKCESSFEQAFEFMKSKYTPFELVGLYW